MASPSIVLDGTMAYGTPNSGVVTINATAYIIEDFAVDRPETTASSRDGQGRPNRQRMTADVATGTATLQLATQTTPYPKFGDTFTFTVDSNYGAELWIIMPVPFEATNGEGDIRVAKITVRKSITGSVTTVA